MRSPNPNPNDTDLVPRAGPPTAGIARSRTPPARQSPPARLREPSRPLLFFLHALEPRLTSNKPPRPAGRPRLRTLLPILPLLPSLDRVSHPTPTLYLTPPATRSMSYSVDDDTKYDEAVQADAGVTRAVQSELEDYDAIVEEAKLATAAQHSLTLREGFRRYPAAMAWSILLSSAL